MQFRTVPMVGGDAVVRHPVGDRLKVCVTIRPVAGGGGGFLRVPTLIGHQNITLVLGPAPCALAMSCAWVPPACR